jgi:hypothetical protein
MHLVVEFSRLSWPPVVNLDSSANRVGWLVPTPHEGDRRAV